MQTAPARGVKVVDRDPKRIASLEAAVEEHLAALGNHALFGQIDTIERVRAFMEHHVYAVWDFMCLLKALQQKVTGSSDPWLPIGDPRTRRLINEICLDEESDELENGRCLSHFEMYLDAMHEAGADTRVVESFVTRLQAGDTVEGSLRIAQVPVPSKNFVMDTMSVIRRGEAHILAAAFTFGRETAIPIMFPSIVRALSRDVEELATLIMYLDRHIELDGDKHGPLGVKMIINLCGDDDTKWQEATEAATKALQSRIVLWDGVLSAIR